MMTEKRIYTIRLIEFGPELGKLEMCRSESTKRNITNFVFTLLVYFSRLFFTDRSTSLIQTCKTSGYSTAKTLHETYISIENNICRKINEKGHAS